MIRLEVFRETASGPVPAKRRGAGLSSKGWDQADSSVPDRFDGARDVKFEKPAKRMS